MTPEQKQRIEHEISNWRNARNDHSAQLTGDRMSALLQELIEAPEPEPVAHATGFYAGYLLMATVADRTLPVGTALYAAPPHQSEHHLEMVNTPAPEVEPVLVVETEPGYWTRGHYHEGSKSYIDPTKVWGLPAGTRLYTAPPAPSVPDEIPDAVIDAVADAIGEAYDCLRVWSAWGYGTMGPDDFLPVTDDAERVAEIARAALSSWLSAAPTPAEPPTDVARDAELLRKLKHSIGQAKISGNDWRRELELMSSMIDAAMSEKGGKK